MRSRDERLHFTELKTLGTRSPLHFRHIVENPIPDTRTFRLGRLSHRAWLLGSLDSIQKWGDDRLTKNGKKANRDKRNPEYAAMLEANNGETPPNEDEYSLIVGMYDALNRSRAAMRLRERCDTFEKYVTWELLGVPMAGTLDARGPGLVLDLKSCEPGKIHPKAFQRQGKRYGYPEQLALYSIGDKQAIKIKDWDWPECYNVAVENARPHDVVVHRLSPLLLDGAIRRASEWVERWKQCNAARHWPGHAEDIVDWNVDPDEMTTEDD